LPLRPAAADHNHRPAIRAQTARQSHRAVSHDGERAQGVATGVPEGTTILEGLEIIGMIAALIWPETLRRTRLPPPSGYGRRRAATRTDEHAAQL